jgi:hypothetical protein
MEKTKESPSSRELALEWWEGLQIMTKRILYKSHYGVTTDDWFWFDDKIENIWRRETKDGSDREIIESVIKPNQKQYKEFSPELFKSYISKFDISAKLEAYKILSEDINKNLL